MFHKILCAMDLSPDSQQPVRLAAQLAKDLGAELVLAHAWHMPALVYAGDYPLLPETAERIEKDARRALSVLRAEAIGIGARRVTTRLVNGAPWKEIVALAQTIAADLVVVGTHGRSGVRRLVLGSVAEKIVAHAPCSVLVARGEPRSFQHVICPIDFSDGSREALRLAGELAHDTITLVHAVELPPWYSTEPVIIRRLDALSHDAAPLLAAAVKDLEQQTKAYVASRATFGGPTPQVLAILDADPRLDLAIIGSHGKSRRLGAMAEALIRHAHCSVLVARANVAHAGERAA